MPGYRFQNFFIDVGFVTQRAGVFRDVEERWVGGVVRKRRQGGVDGANPQLHALDAAERSETRGAVRVQFDRNAARVLENDRRSEERRVGKECRSRWSWCYEKEKI